MINPIIVEGQIHGGVVHGIGQALSKARCTTEKRASSSAARSWTTPCRGPTTCRRTSSAPVTLCPCNPIGVKGCGEAGAIGSPPAVINAITDAIGNNDLRMPATPEKVWIALQKAPARKPPVRRKRRCTRPIITVRKNLTEAAKLFAGACRGALPLRRADPSSDHEAATRRALRPDRPRQIARAEGDLGDRRYGHHRRRHHPRRGHRSTRSRRRFRRLPISPG